MMIDIFQYSNMYTLRKSMQWLADEGHIKEECGPYVTKPGWVIPDWPKLLHLYSRFRAGKTMSDGSPVSESSRVSCAESTAGPSFSPPPEPPVDRRTGMASLGRRRGKSFASIMTNPMAPDSPPTRTEPEQVLPRGRVFEARPTMASAGAELVATSLTNPQMTPAAVSAASVLPHRRASAAESSLEMLRNSETRKQVGGRAYQTMSRLSATAFKSAGRPPGDMGGIPTARYTVSSSPDAFDRGLLGAGGEGSSDPLESEQSSGGRSALLARTRLTRDSSQTRILQGPVAQFPPELLPLLDGEHHTDEICTRFEVGWPVLRQWLFVAGGAKEGDEEYGNISIIYR
uniref:Phosphate import ATP-binding protein PstB (Phosphate-transporting ATPase)) n=1 Tax=Ganoderma boninense TaxID=34458 RepID=A0A5K1K3S7_9APHY|nr:Phosphate import ATP-binding protein PstB (EC (ABC phosphate transporter) (Phosphate-transporting ATPase) [Ganoderma boninense]